MNKPTDDKQFEVMVRNCAEMKYLQYFTLLGREKRQAQHGGDIASQDWNMIIQCKCYDQNKGRASYSLLVRKIKEDYEKACDHFCKMNLFVVATTLDRDLPTQEAIHEIERDVPIQTLFWEDIAPLYVRFEEKYKLKEIRLALDAELERERNCHPSFILMDPDEIDGRLFSTYKGANLEAKVAVLGEIKVSPIWKRIQGTWCNGQNRSVVIIGKGGIGKTVALFSLTNAKEEYSPAPAIYIQLFRLVKSDGSCRTIPEYLAEKHPDLHETLHIITSRSWEDGPRLLLLLDGFNEVPATKRRRVLQNINEWRNHHPGAQLIIASRPMDNLNLEQELTGGPIDKKTKPLVMELQPIDRYIVCNYLSEQKVPIPGTGESIWNNLIYPLFLTLYVKTTVLKESVNSGYPLAIREARNGGALIWNYLQRELMREESEWWVLRCAVACEFIAPAIAYRMVKAHQFSLGRELAKSFILEALEEFDSEKLPRHLKKVWKTHFLEHDSFPEILYSSEEEKKVWYDVVLRESCIFVKKELETPKDNVSRSEGNQDQDESDLLRYEFLHQNFRDCLAGLYLVNQAEMAGENEFPEIWGRSQSHLALGYAAELMDSGVFSKLWEANLEARKCTMAGRKINHTSTCNLLELCKQNNGLPQELDFSGMDLHGLSLTRYLGKAGNALPLFRNRCLSKGTYLDRSIFESAGHEEPISVLAVLQDGRLISGSDDCTLRVWDAATGECTQALEGHTSAITCVAVLPDQRMVSGSFDNTLRVWDVGTGECLQTLKGHRDWIKCVTVLPDGRVVSGSADCTLRVWDAATGKCQATLKGHKSQITCVAVLPDGRVVSGSWDNTLRVWDAVTGECAQTLEGHTDMVFCVVVLPDGRVVSGSGDNTLQVWDAGTGKCVKILDGHRLPIDCVTVLPNGRVVSGSDDSTLRVWDAATGQCVQTLEGHRLPITCIAVHQDGRIVSGSIDRTLRVWDAASGKCQQTMEGYEGSIYRIAVLPDGRVVSGSWDNTLRVWDAATGRCQQTLKGHRSQVYCVAILPNGRVVSGSDDSTLRVWDAATGHCVQTLYGHCGPINCVAVLPDGRVVSGSSDRTLRVWDIGTGQCLQTLEGHREPINCIAILPDGRFVSGSIDSTLRVWDAMSGECLRTLEGHEGLINCVDVLPDGRVVSGSSDSTLRVWDATSGECQQILKGHKESITCVAILPDGRVVSGSWDYTLRVWNAATGECQQTLEGHDHRIECVAVLLDGRVVSGSLDNTLLVWEVASGKCQQILEGHTDPITCIAILPGGWVVSGSHDRTVRVWNTKNGECLDTMEATEIDVSSMDLSSAILTGDLARLLWHNRATISDIDYKQHVEPFRKSIDRNH